MYSSSEGSPYRDKRKRTVRMSASLEQQERNRKAAADGLLRGGPRPVTDRIRIVHREKTPEEIHQRESFITLEALKIMPKILQRKRYEEKAARNRSLTKGSVLSRRGATDDDPLHTATWDRINLDSGSVVMGDGRFDVGRKGEEGRFIPAGTFIGPEYKVTREDGTVEFVSKAIPNLGPFAFGDRYITDGKGAQPGTDRRRFDQMPHWRRDSMPAVPESGWKRVNPSVSRAILAADRLGFVTADVSARALFRKAK